MADNIENNGEYLPLSEDEHRALELWDKLQELQLEIAIINAQQAPSPGSNTDVSTANTGSINNELLEARAKYMLQNTVIEYVMTANPILKAVHNSRDATPAERDLLPEIQKRDKVSISTATLASSSKELRGEAVKTQSEALKVSRKNVELAAEVMTLVAQSKENKTSSQDDERLRQLKGDIKSSRQRWRIVKGVVGAMVTGSGVDWARDEKLQDLVLGLDETDEF